MKKIFILSALLLSHNVFASGGGTRQPDPILWKSSCSECHIAFPIKSLQPNQWGLVLSNLQNHYGTNAEIDYKTLEALFLYTKSAKTEPSKNNLPKLTEEKWFNRIHDEVSDSTWTRKSIKSKSNCIACHAKADTGSYSERDIRIPK